MPGKVGRNSFYHGYKWAISVSSLNSYVSIIISLTYFDNWTTRIECSSMSLIKFMLFNYCILLCNYCILWFTYGISYFIWCNWSIYMSNLASNKFPSSNTLLHSWITISVNYWCCWNFLTFSLSILKNYRQLHSLYWYTYITALGLVSHIHIVFHSSYTFCFKYTKISCCIHCCLVVEK